MATKRRHALPLPQENTETPAAAAAPTRPHRGAKTSGARKPARRGAVDPTKALKGLKGAWKKSRTSRPRGFAVADIPDGTFAGQVSNAKLAVAKSGDPYFAIEWVLLAGDYEGTQLRQSMTLSDRVINDEGVTLLDLFSQTLQQMGYNTDQMSEDDLQGLPAEMLANPPICALYVVTKQDASGRVRQNVYVNNVLGDGELENWQDQIVE